MFIKLWLPWYWYPPCIEWKRLYSRSTVLLFHPQIKPQNTVSVIPWELKKIYFISLMNRFFTRCMYSYIQCTKIFWNVQLCTKNSHINCTVVYYVLIYVQCTVVYNVQSPTMYKDILKCTVMHKVQSYKLYSRILCTHLCTMYCGLQCTVPYNVQRYFAMYSYAQNTVM